MAHFAKIENGVVTNVVVADQDWVNTQEGQWVQTSYNTKGGVHYGPDGQPDGGVALRKNYASVGFTYDSVRDAFIPPQTFSKWVLDEQTCLWVPPVPIPAQPTDGTRVRYHWDDVVGAWVV